MATTIITIRTDDLVKQQAQQLFRNLGLDMSGAVNAFLRAAIKENGLPFAITLEPDAEYRAYIKARLDKAARSLDDPNTKLVPHDEVWAAFKSKWGKVNDELSD